MGCAGSKETAYSAGATTAVAAGAVGAAVASGAGSAVPALTAVAAGTGLLEVAKHVPFVAPLAFMVGGVAVACKNAKRLKKDCHAFGVVIVELEAALLKATNLADSEDTVESICEELEDSMTFIKGLAKKNRLVKLCASGWSRERLANSRDRIMQLVQSLQFSVALDLHNMQAAKFEEERQIGDLVEQMGGMDAVVADESKFEQLEQCLSNSDKLMVCLHRELYIYTGAHIYQWRER